MNISRDKNAPQKIIHGRCLCGAARWSIHGGIIDATICNCTACRRSGALWAYDYEGHGIHVTAPEGGLTAYLRGDRSPLSFNFCRVCGNLVCWRSTRKDDEGRTRIAVNLRLADDPADVAGVPIQRFEGLHSFEDLPKDGRTVADVWF